MSDSVRRGVVALTISQVVFLVSGFIVHFVLGRKLGPSEYGVYGILLTFISTVSLILTSGIPESVSKHVAQDQAQARGILRTGLVIQGVVAISLSGLLIILAPLISTILRDQQLSTYIKIAALSLPFVGAYAVLINLFNGLHDFRRQGALIGLYGVVRLVLILSLVGTYHLTGASVAFVIAPMTVLVAGFFVWTRLPAAPAFPYRRLLDFGFPVVAFTVIMTGLMNLDLLMLKSLGASGESVGLYTAAGTISRVPYFIFSAVGMVLLPVVSGAWSRDEKPKAVQLVADTSRRLFVLISAAAAVAAALAPQVLQILYSSVFSAAAVQLMLLLGSSVFFTLFFIVAYALNGAGRPRLAMAISAVGLLVHTPILWLAIRHGGSAGAAIATFASSLGLCLGILYAARRVLGRLIPVATFLRVALAAGLTVAVGVWIRPTLIFTLPVGLLLVAIYAIALYCLREFRKSDKEFFRSFHPRALWSSRDQV